MVNSEQKPLCELRNIHKWYGQVHALKGVSLSVLRGECVGLIGDNGAGKSTLIKIITGVIQPNNGEIFFEGKCVKIDSVQKSREMGIETVYQDRAVIGNLNIAENIFMAREQTHKIGLLNRNFMEKKAEELTRRLDLNIMTPRQEARFCSGGERQGIAIARAMYFKSKLVILDEPTTALSAKGVMKVSRFVEHLKKENIGIIEITHNLQHIYYLADKFVVMSRGEVINILNKKEVTINDIEKILFMQER